MVGQEMSNPGMPILKDFPDSFETRRLVIRSPMHGDGAELNAAIVESLEQLRPWAHWAQKPPTVEESEELSRRGRIAFLKRSELPLHLLLKGTSTIIGAGTLHQVDWSVPKFEIGLWCRTRFTGQGYATEAVSAIVDFAFQYLEAQRIEARCSVDNERSIKVARRTGFRFEGELRNNKRAPDGTLRSTLVFSMVLSEYEALKR
jgi:RimJ/RimL family protein N-acetyltransferase